MIMTTIIMKKMMVLIIMEVANDAVDNDNKNGNNNIR